MPQTRTPAEWADANRILPPGSAEPGPWRSTRNPYMIPIVQACVSPQYRRVIAIMASQMGKTASLLNVIGHRLDDDPAPIIYVGPTRSNIDNVIEPKITELIKNVPSLWAKLAKGKKSTKTHKRIAGVSLRLAWSGSPTELASDSAVLVLVDEIDRMEDNIKGEGNVVELAEARTSTYADGRVIGTSTPTIGNVETYIHPKTGLEHWAVSDTVGSAIWRLWQEGSRHEWAWPCPFCREYFIPRLRHLVWPDKATPDEARLKAKLACSRCGVLIGDEYKAEMNRRGVYVAPGQSVTQAGEVLGEADTVNSDMASFWVSGICSFSPKKSFGFLAKKFVAAVRSGEPERIQGVINTDFGELFRVGGDAPDWSMVASRKLGYQSGAVPQGINLITAGVDVQKDRLVYVIRGWGKKYESWLIEHGELWGETERPAVWQQLSELLNTTRDGLPIFRMAIDSGYQTEQVYKFCRLHRPMAIPTKGHDNLDKPFKAINIEVNVRGKQLQHSVQLWHFNSDIMKCWIYGRIEWPPDQPGGWWLPQDATEDYCKQVVSEQRAVNPSGKVTWVKIRRDNHYFDAEVLAYLAVRIVTAGRERLLDSRAMPSPKKRIISKGITL